MMNTEVLKIATLWLLILHSLFSLCFHQTLWIFEDVCVNATTQRPAVVEPFNSHGVIGIFFLFSRDAKSWLWRTIWMRTSCSRFSVVYTKWMSINDDDVLFIWAAELRGLQLCGDAGEGSSLTPTDKLKKNSVTMTALTRRMALQPRRKDTDPQNLSKSCADAWNKSQLSTRQRHLCVHETVFI